MIAAKLLPERHRWPVEDASRQLRDLELMTNTSTDKEFPKTGPALRRYRRRVLQLPSDNDLRSSSSTREQQKELEKKRKEEEEEAKRREQAEEKLTIYKRLTAAIDVITQFAIRGPVPSGAAWNQTN
jgi:hypothetical protein